MSAGQITGAALQAGGYTTQWGVGMLSSYINYKQQKAMLKQQYANAKANAAIMTDNANAALDTLSYNEGVLSREHNRRIAAIETAFAASGVSGASVSAQDVLDAQTAADTEELWQMRTQVDGEVGALILDRNNMLTEAEAAYKWGKRANMFNTVFSMIGQTSNFLANMATIGGNSGVSAMSVFSA